MATGYELLAGRRRGAEGGRRSGGRPRRPPREAAAPGAVLADRRRRAKGDRGAGGRPRRPQPPRRGRPPP
ncbi:hypothetical protein U9M48_005792 [Paspalum notatum var. saurae]|uniref:Uncharacterized protein n=1 Tax=Paspalum notatum var. saurae TaxID=547442 RepID=A0AAQ3PML5_PASNO